MEQTQQMEIAGSQAVIAGALSQYLTFTLGQEAYGIEILKVQEIKGYRGITPIPNTPPHVKGVMNLRGTVIPVVDLRTKFAMPAVEYDKFTVIVVVTMGSKVAGLVVDAVSDVLNISPSDMRPAPDFGSRADTRFITGLAGTGDRLTVLLDIERLLTDEDMAAAPSVS